MKMRATSRATDKKPWGNNELKTHTLVSRTAYMIEDGVSASSILLFTFTKKAANEIKERVQKRIGDKAFGITVSTYHSFCARQLRRYCNYLGYTDNFSIIDQEQQSAVISRILSKMGSGTKAREVLSAISSFKDKHWTPREAARHMEGKPEQQENLLVYEAYQKKLKENNAMDFDDLLFNMTTILEKFEIVRQRMWSKFRYICADESQDSSVLDSKFIFLLSNPAKRNLCLIFDDDQAIYGFRGANFLQLYDKIQEIPHQTFVLGQNYRSTKNIVNAAQSLIRYNERPIPKKLFTENETGEKITHLVELTSSAEAEDIAAIIQHIIDNSDATYEDFALLYRMSYLSRAIEDVFVRRRIPYRMVGGMSFYSHKEIRDIIAFIDFFENPKNFLSLERIINIPKSGLGEKSIGLILEKAGKECGSYDIMRLKDALGILQDIASSDTRLSKKLLPFVDRCRKIDDYLASGEGKPANLIEKIITVFDYGNYLRKTDEENYEDRLMNVRELQNIAMAYDDTQDFLESVLSNTGNDATDDGTPRVSLMTMHASKGLEFRFVFIVGANDGIVPSWRCNEAENPQMAVQEERRLFYVAMTRAKENLFISSPLKALRRGRLVDTAPSSFISQIQKEYVEKVDRTLPPAS